MKTFFNYKTITVAASKTTTVQAGGAFVLFTASNLPFEFAIDDGDWNAGNVGMEFRLEGIDQPFSRIHFRNTSATTSLTVSFYAGVGSISDRRLSVGADAGAAVPVKNPATAIAPYDDTLGAGATATFDQANRRAIIITNPHATDTLEVQVTSGGAAVSFGVVQPLQSWTFETDAEVKVKNPGSNPIRLLVAEIYYVT